MCNLVTTSGYVLVQGPKANDWRNVKRTAEREQFLADIIITAVEGGTGYWAAVSAYKWTEGAAATRATLHELNDEQTAFDGDEHKLTIDAIATGIGRIERGEVGVNDRIRKAILEASRENDAGMIDADDADVIAQAAVLGELRYG